MLNLTLSEAKTVRYALMRQIDAHSFSRIIVLEDLLEKVNTFIKKEEEKE